MPSTGRSAGRRGPRRGWRRVRRGARGRAAARRAGRAAGHALRRLRRRRARRPVPWCHPDTLTRHASLGVLLTNEWHELVSDLTRGSGGSAGAIVDFAAGAPEVLTAVGSPALGLHPEWHASAAAGVRERPSVVTACPRAALLPFKLAVPFKHHGAPSTSGGCGWRPALACRQPGALAGQPGCAGRAGRPVPAGGAGPVQRRWRDEAAGRDGGGGGGAAGAAGGRDAGGD